MKTIVISVIPKLNEVQQAGISELIASFTSLGFQVFFWSDHSYPQFEGNNVLKKAYEDSNLKNLRRYTYEIKARLLLDKKKWIDRLQVWLNVDAVDAKKQFRRYIKESTRVLTVTKPDYFFCWNPYCCRFGIAFDIAKLLGFKTCGIEWGYLPNTFLIDKSGTLASSDLFNSNPLEGYKENELIKLKLEGEKIAAELMSHTLSIYQQLPAVIPHGFKEASGDKAVRVLVLGIDEIDAGAYPVDHPDREGLLPFHTSSFEQAKDIASENSGYQVIYKPHPSHNKYKEDKLILDNLAIVNGNPDNLIDWADVVFCSGSKMEFSVLLKNKPLLTYGAGLLFGKNCSYEVKDPALLEREMEKALNHFEFEEKLSQFKSFLGYLRVEYLFDMSNGSNKIVANTVGVTLYPEKDKLA